MQRSTDDRVLLAAAARVAQSAASVKRTRVGLGLLPVAAALADSDCASQLPSWARIWDGELSTLGTSLGVHADGLAAAVRGYLALERRIVADLTAKAG